MHRSVLMMYSVVCTKFHGYISNFEEEKRIIKLGPKKTTRIPKSRDGQVNSMTMLRNHFNLG